MLRIFAIFLALTMSASAQQPDPSKVLPWVQMQRNASSDAVAQCSALANDQQAKIAELEKQLAELKAPK